MNRFTPSLIAAFSLILAIGGTAHAQQKPPPVLDPVPAVMPEGVKRSKPAYIIIKIDDMVQSKSGPVDKRWIKITDFLKSRKIPCGIGIICNSLEKDNPAYFQWIKDQKAGGLVEFWCHGYDHKQTEMDDPTNPGKKITISEFKGTGFEHQRDALQKSEALAKAKLGFPLAAFGAGFNSGDDDTAKALEAVPELTIWLYGEPKTPPAGKLVLERIGAVNIEQPTFVPNFARFVSGYNRFPNAPFFVIQGHPTHWDDAKFAQFEGIVDFLSKNGAIFTTPSEYAATVKAAGAK